MARDTVKKFLLSASKATRPSLALEMKILIKGRSRILQSGDWLNTFEVIKLGQLSMTDVDSNPSEWKRTGRIFTIHPGASEYFPLYGLDPSNGYQPRASLAAILTVLAPRKSSWGLALWFGSSNVHLAGRMPKEMLAKDPQAVLEAANEEVIGISHG